MTARLTTSRVAHSKRQQGSKGMRAAGANGAVNAGKTVTAQARARRIPVTLPAISIQKRSD